MASVRVQALDPTQGRLMAEVGRPGGTPVAREQADAPNAADHVSCRPSGWFLGIHGRALRPTTPTGPANARKPIEVSRRAFAADAPGQSIELLFTTKPQGMKRGLAISRTIAKVHNGWLVQAPRAVYCRTPVGVPLPRDAIPGGSRT